MPFGNPYKAFWDKLNSPLWNPDTSGLEQYLNPEDEATSPQMAGMGTFSNEMLKRSAGLASSFTSPVNIGLAGMGALGQVPRLAKAIHAAQVPIGAGFALQGMGNIAHSQDEEGNIDYQRILENAPQVLLGLAGAKAGSAPRAGRMSPEAGVLDIESMPRPEIPSVSKSPLDIKKTTSGIVDRLIESERQPKPGPFAPPAGTKIKRLNARGEFEDYVPKREDEKGSLRIGKPSEAEMAAKKNFDNILNNLEAAKANLSPEAYKQALEDARNDYANVLANFGRPEVKKPEAYESKYGDLAKELEQLTNQVISPDEARKELASRTPLSDKEKTALTEADMFENKAGIGLGTTQETQAQLQDVLTELQSTTDGSQRLRLLNRVAKLTNKLHTAERLANEPEVNMNEYPGTIQPAPGEKPTVVPPDEARTARILKQAEINAQAERDARPKSIEAPKLTEEQLKQLANAKPDEREILLQKWNKKEIPIDLGDARGISLARKQGVTATTVPWNTPLVRPPANTAGSRAAIPTGVPNPSSAGGSPPVAPPGRPPVTSGSGSSIPPGAPKKPKLTFMQKLEEVNAIPRVLKQVGAPADYAMRHAVTQSFSHPHLMAKSVGTAYKATFNKQYSEQAGIDLENRPHGKHLVGAKGEVEPSVYEKSGLEFTTRKGKPSVSQEESFYAGDIARRIIPGAEQTERGMVAGLNQLRADRFDQLVKNVADNQTFEQNPELYKEIGKYVNQATGRGTMGSTLGGASRFLSHIFYSPRLQLSRLQLMGRAITEPAKLMTGMAKNPKLSKEISKDMYKFAGGISTILAMAKAGGADITLDPRSNEFGKAKVGNMLFDMTGGFAPWISFIAREQPEFLKDLGLPVSGFPPSGKKQNPAVKMDIFTRFLAYRATPGIAGTTTSYLYGKTPGGRKVNAPNLAYEQLTPFALQEPIDIGAGGGTAGQMAAAILPGQIGVTTRMLQSKTKTPGYLKVRPP